MADLKEKTLTQQFTAVADDGVLTISPVGNKIWCNAKGKKHRLSGPAVQRLNNDREWWVDGQRHRLDGPAVEVHDGTREWWVKGQLHRTDGPAVMRAGGARVWYENGQKHRLDGPAAEYGERKEYWLQGQKITEEAFLEQTKDYRAAQKKKELEALRRQGDTVLADFRRWQQTL